MKSILFVCLGNICRSPIAEGYARQVLKEKGFIDIVIDSAGTSAHHIGEHPCKDSIKVAKAHGVDISHQHSRQVKQSDFTKFDLIVALDESNYQDLKYIGATHIVKLGSYGYEGADVPDPYYFHDFEGFEKVYEMISHCVTKLLDEEIEAWTC